jgi:biotin transport system substrate-specific component
LLYDYKHASSPLSHAASVPVPGLGRKLAACTLGVLLFATLTFVGANIRIPLQPVPITLQTLFVLLSGAALGARFGSLSQFVYVALGGFGLPIFAESLAGFGVLIGPTGGYLLGFLAAPVFVGYFIDRRSTLWWNLVIFFVGSLIVLSLGVVHLTLFYTHDLVESLKVGYLPFIPGDLLKILAATSIYRSYRGLRRMLPRG